MFVDARLAALRQPNEVAFGYAPVISTRRAVAMPPGKSALRAGEHVPDVSDEKDPRMDQQVVELAKQLLESGFDRFSDRERRVLIRVAKRLHVTQDVNRAVEEKQTFGDRLADRVARFGGSWAFIMIFLGVLIAWTGLNTTILRGFGEAFDPYPYIFLNLILSMLAAVQAPVILMSQNRQAKRDRLAAGLDYEINLKAEIEIMALHEKLDRIRVDHLEGVLNAQQEQLRQLLQLIAAKERDQPS
jgi:uncharacterized membrane protein